MSRLDSPILEPRVVDTGILVAVVALLATGVASMFAATPATAWVYVLHGTTGVLFLALVVLKLWRVRHRVRVRPSGVWTSLLLAALSVAALATGFGWVFGLELDVGFWGLLNVHIAFGLLVAPVVLFHLRRRFAVASRETLTQRRTVLRSGGLLVGGAVAWRAQQSLNRLLDTAGADRRFTGSRPAEGDSGNDFPVTMWMADDPDPIDTDSWTLSVGGLTERSLSVGADELDPDSEQRALLDCTSGWYAERDWQGLSVGDLLDAVEPHEDAAWVQFRSVTGYRWTLPIDEARDALLATHVDGQRLSHGHGYPLRLVAPDRRGYQWVKWVESVEVSRSRDLSESIAIFVSGL
ncbi:molybdopterin-dependent oxidoreductase [Halapricum hydrolyticum]|uniref:Molybdopterin-dependent oxidoreductase n=1 Tax=Halapricum hydrolyticum TaxID=2979991 RepID=A0AAE3IDJ1_9EURY|nr:molybdopterin-dependent oxidoreductase [Halapricum hydrolyticum]MCU4717440.1 molybdopterin-dependent oxidoreductase [Halapricum hydrolyticum]MCU4726604.1 molybdopterin-dependent oxidoreductase [Halapricum hydrolyticum]